VRKEQGYTCQNYDVTTDDNYILTMNRIPKGLNSTTGKGVILYNHGFMDSSIGAVMNTRYEGLPFFLADAGYDVWLGNNRGNGQSMKHKTLTPKDNAFWDFTFDEMGMYDLPAQIQFVLNSTGAKTLTYIGHSQGTIQAFIGFQNPALAAKVNLFIALAPVAWLSNQGSASLKLIAALKLDELLAKIGMHEFALPDFVQALLPPFCQLNVSQCSSFVYDLMGQTKHFNESRIPYYVRFFPAPSSVKNLGHWLQQVRAPVFQMYDYGTPAENQKHYNRTTPPQWDPSKIPASLKIALLYGENDYLGDPTDVRKLAAKLPKAGLVFNKEYLTYAHADFILAFDAWKICFPDILQLLPKFAEPVSVQADA